MDLSLETRYRLNLLKQQVTTLIENLSIRDILWFVEVYPVELMKSPLSIQTPMLFFYDKISELHWSLLWYHIRIYLPDEASLDILKSWNKMWITIYYKRKLFRVSGEREEEAAQRKMNSVIRMTNKGRLYTCGRWSNYLHYKRPIFPWTISKVLTNMREAIKP